MKSLDSLLDSEKELIVNPFALYTLYILYRDGSNADLPRFISRRKENIFLIDKGLIEFTTSKKMHYQHVKFTKEGLNTYKKLEEKGIFQTFENINLSSLSLFERDYERRLKRIIESYIPTESAIYKILYQKIGVWLNPNKISYRIKNIAPISIEEDSEIIEFDFEMKCIGCNTISCQKIEIGYDLNVFETSPRKIKCNLCGETYMLCPNFECLYSISRL